MINKFYKHSFSGIAAQLLHLGRTYHSRFKAPLDPTPESTLNITGQSTLAKLVRRARILMIDEATMLHEYQLQALDRTLRDLMQKNDAAFGGKVNEPLYFYNYYYHY